MPLLNMGLMLVILILQAGRYFGGSEAATEEWRKHVNEKLHAVNGLAEWRRHADNERVMLANRIDKQHESQKEAMASLRADAHLLVDHLERRLTERCELLRHQHDKPGRKGV